MTIQGADEGNWGDCRHVRRCGERCGDDGCAGELGGFDMVHLGVPGVAREWGELCITRCWHILCLIYHSSIIELTQLHLCEARKCGARRIFLLLLLLLFHKMLKEINPILMLSQGGGSWEEEICSICIARVCKFVQCEEICLELCGQKR